MALLIQLQTSPATHDIRRRWLGTRSYWLCQALGWGGILAMTIAPLPFGAEKPTPQALANTLACLALCALGSHLLRVVLLHLLQHSHPILRLAMTVAPWALLIAASVTFVIMTINQMLAASDPSVAHDAVLWSLADYVGNLFVILLLILIWSGVYFLVRIYRQSQQDKLDHARVQTETREAELRALKAQLNPHFLFNSLNSLRALMPPEHERSRATVSRLAGLLRASLATDHEPLVPLSRELAMVENYLEIEKLRHEDRLRWIIGATVEAKAWPVPPFLMQGLVENAIKHGINRLEAGGEIQIAAQVVDERLRIDVTSPGSFDAASESTGLGIANARARLRLLFGPDASLDLLACTGNRVRARIDLPRPLAAAPCPAPPS
jgi:hypothetical protein